VAAVIAALRDDVGAEVEKLERQTLQQLARLQAEEAGESLSVPDREARLAAAAREAQSRLAREEWQGAREVLEEREKWIDRIVAAGRTTLSALEAIGQRRADLVRLARDGLDRLPGQSFEVVVSAADAAILDQSWCQEVAGDGSKRQVRLVIDGAIPNSSCIVRTADGKVSFDNTFPARAERFQSAWRAALGEIYES
jgi:vacuolar-type H+-ATPase subunit E/Vma4